MFRHLRHRSIENPYPTHRFDKLLHEVPLDPLLWTTGASRSGLEPAAGTSSTSMAKYCGEWGSSGSSPCSSTPPLPGPGCPLAPWGCVVRRFSQGHCDGHPLMPQHGAQPSLSPPTCGSRSDVNTTVRHHEVFTKRSRRKRKRLSGNLCCCCFRRVPRCAMCVSTRTWQCKSLRLIGGRSPGRLTPGDRATPRGLPKNH